MRSCSSLVLMQQPAEQVTPVQAPNANAFVERWIGTARAECFDWLLIVGQGTWSVCLGSMSTTTTVIVRTGHSGWSRRIRPRVWTSPARASKVRSAAAIGSAVSSMNTAELHERISAPHGLPARGGSWCPSRGHLSADHPTPRPSALPLPATQHRQRHLHQVCVILLGQQALVLAHHSGCHGPPRSALSRACLDTGPA
jgi:hypothetical protein